MWSSFYFSSLFSWSLPISLYLSHSSTCSLCITLSFGVKLAELVLALNNYVIDWGQRHAMCALHTNVLNFRRNIFIKLLQTCECEHSHHRSSSISLFIQSVKYLEYHKSILKKSDEEKKLWWEMDEMIGNPEKKSLLLNWYDFRFIEMYYVMNVIIASDRSRVYARVCPCAWNEKKWQEFNDSFRAGQCEKCQ